MIKRTASKVTSSVVNAAQSESLTAVAGIKTGTPVTDLQSATNITNFDINSDGTLTLRDPLIYVENPSQALVSRYIFDYTNQLRIVRVPTTTPFMEMSIIAPDGTRNQIYLRYTTYTGQVIDENFTKDLVLNWEQCEFLDTASSTIIAKALVNLTLLPNSYRTDTLDTDKASSIFRFLNLFFDTDKNYWVIELISPEVNTIIADSNSFEANANLDNIYAVRDLYNYGKASVTGILPYMFKNTPQTPSYQLISTAQLNVNPWQGIFSLKLCKNDSGNIVYNLSTKIPISFQAVNEIYNSQPTFTEVKTFLEAANSAQRIVIEFGDDINSTTNSYATGLYIPANTIVAAGSIGENEYISIILPSNKIYCYPKGTDLEYFKDTIATVITLNSNTYRYEIPSTIDPTEDIFEKDLNSNGFTLDFYNSEFQLVKHTRNSNYNYVQCVSNPTDRSSIPDHFIFNKSYGAFKTATVFYVWKHNYNADYTAILNSLKIYELTESVKNTREIYLLDSINNNETRPIILKALITTPTDKVLNYYCNWEESDDGGLTWQVASAFLNKFKNSIHYIPKDVLTKTDETLENADDYITYVEAVPFNPTSEEDLISERPDVLYVLDFNTSKRYRFNIYYNATPEKTEQTYLPNFKMTISNASTPQIECPKYKGWYVINAVPRVFTSDTNILPDLHISISSDLTNSSYKDYALVIQSSANLRKEFTFTHATKVINASSTFSFSALFLQTLRPLLKTDELSHVEQLTYWVTYKSKIVKGSIGHILYYYSNYNSNNYNLYDYNWVVSGIQPSTVLHINTDPELVCNILSETATITNSNNKETSLDILEKNRPSSISLGDVKHYFDTPDSGETSTTKEEGVENTSDPIVKEKEWEDLLCRPEYDPVLKYDASFTLYNNSNRPKIVHYFIAHPNTEIYIDTRATGNESDTVSILPKIKSGNVSITFDNVTHTSEVTETTTSSSIGNISTDMEFSKYKYITIPAHSSITGSVHYTCTTKLEFSYWAISIAARMFLAMFFQTTEGFTVLTSKGTANKYPWTQYIWGNYPKLPCDSTSDEGYSSRVFSNPEYKNETLNKEPLTLYNFQSLPKFLSKDYKVKSAGIRAYVLANQLEYTSLNTNLSQTKFALDNTINLQVGDFTYYDNRIFAYNIPGHVNSVYISNVDSFIMPLNNSLEITFGNTITKLVPWRNYLIAFTKSSIHLISYSEDLGYTAKVINTAVGMPMQDKDSAVTVLNSIIFKSGTKVYKLIPNLYSTSDTILNITCISDSINSYLEDINLRKEFAFSTYDEYVLCCIVGRSTTVFKYNYTSKIWTKHTYPVDFTDYKLITPDEIYIYKNVCKYIFNKKLDLLLDKEVCDVLPYGDYLNSTLSELATYITDHPTISQNDISSIPFEIEFRQKSSTYQADKQFLESKIILAVESAKPVFPFNIDIASDGMPRVVHIDANTDGPFWQDNLEQTGVLNTLFKSNSSTSESTLKQVFIKYSGKGKTITHKLYGNSNSKFTFYTVNYRYRLLPKKQ